MGLVVLILLCVFLLGMMVRLLVSCYLVVCCYLCLWVLLLLVFVTTLILFLLAWILACRLCWCGVLHWLVLFVSWFTYCNLYLWFSW